jgi:hypothetical protein
LRVTPLRNVNFSVRVGTVVPASVRLVPLPSEIVEIVPQYRGYGFVVVEDEIVIVQPRTHEIVAVLPYSGGGTASRTESSSTRLSLSNDQRQVIRRQVITRETTAQVPGSDLVIGETLPDAVVIREFPTTVYTEVPTIRSYRYIQRGGEVYVVNPGDRRIIDVIE